MPRYLLLIGWLLTVVLVSVSSGDVVRADSSHWFADYRLCPLSLQVQGPQDLQAARGLKGGELRVFWKQATAGMPGSEGLDETAITVIVGAGTDTIVRQVPPTATDVILDSVPRGRDLEIVMALTRRDHVISDISRTRLAATRTTTVERPRREPTQTTSQAHATQVPVPSQGANQLQDLATVQGFQVAGVTDSSVGLNWTAPASTLGLDKFRIETCSSAGNNCPGASTVATPAKDATSITLSTLQRNTNYHLRITALALADSGYQNSTPSSIVTAKTTKTQHAAVTNFRHDSSSLTHSTAKLQWDAVSPTPDKYKIESCSSSGANCPSATQEATPAGSATSHDLSSLTRNASHYYRIKALADPNGDFLDSSWTSILTVDTAKEPLATVANFRHDSSSLTHNTAKLQWDAVSPTPDKYRIESCSSSSAGCPDATLVTSPAGSATSHDLSSLTRNTAYYYRIKALAASSSDYSDSSWASILTVTTAKEPLAALSGFTIARVKPPNTPITIKLSWDANSQTGLDKYELVECSDANCSSTNNTYSVTGTSYQRTVQRSTSYYFRVRAKATITSDYADGPWTNTKHLRVG